MSDAPTPPNDLRAGMLGKLNELAAAGGLRHAKPYDGDEMIRWAEQNIRVDGRPFSLREREPLIAIYKESTPEFAVMKSSQIGLSILAIVRALHFLIEHQGTVIYTMPTDTDVREFSKGRFNPMIQESHVLRSSLNPSADSVSLRQFGPRGFLYMRGTVAARQAQSVPTDVLIHDEIDFSDPTVINQYRGRTSVSPYAWRWVFGTPRDPDFGADRAFKASDMREWMVKCLWCNRHTAVALSWPDIIQPVTAYPTPTYRADLEKAGHRYYFACPACRRHLTNEARAAGEWVPQIAEGGRMPGYHPTNLCMPYRTADWVMHQEQQFDKKRDFFNLVLGLPYEISARRFTHQVFAHAYDGRCRFYHSMTDSPTFMGVDQGDMLYVSIFKPVKLDNGDIGRQLIYFDQFPSYHGFQTLERFMSQFNVQRCVVDALPNKQDARRFVEKFPGRAFMAFYKSPKASHSVPVDVFAEWERSENKVTIYRTDSFDRLFDDFHEHRVIVPREPQTIEPQWFLHHTNLKREVDLANDVSAAVYKAVGADHYAHSHLYAMVAMLGQTKRSKVRAVMEEAPEGSGEKARPMTQQESIELAARDRQARQSSGDVGLRDVLDDY